MLKKLICGLFLVLAIQAQKLPDGCLNTFRSISLKVSNAYRQKHASQPMVANQTLDDSAQTYAEYLAKTNTFAHSKNRKNTAENLYVTYTDDPLTLNMCAQIALDCVKCWYDEVSNYNFKNPGFSIPTGHFTALIWNATNKLGMGLAAGKSEDDFNAYYCVAHSTPGGNVMSKELFAANVKPKIEI